MSKNLELRQYGGHDAGPPIDGQVRCGNISARARGIALAIPMNALRPVPRSVAPFVSQRSTQIQRSPCPAQQQTASWFYTQAPALLFCCEKEFALLAGMSRAAAGDASMVRTETLCLVAR